MQAAGAKRSHTQAMECNVCKAERKRRCRVLHGPTHAQTLHLSGTFARDAEGGDTQIGIIGTLGASASRCRRDRKRRRGRWRLGYRSYFYELLVRTIALRQMAAQPCPSREAGAGGRWLHNPAPLGRLARAADGCAALPP